jgi:hypothetical protein
MSAQSLVTFGCGAGTQSTAIYFLIRDGVIERPDAVLFADTGDEPRRVYANVSFLRRGFGKLGIPFYIVSRFGRGTNIAADVLNRRIYATIPAYTVIEKTMRVPLSWRPCDCGWSRLYRAVGEPGVAAVATFAAGTTRAQITRHTELHLGGGDCEICSTESDAEPVRGVDELASLTLDEAAMAVVPRPHQQCRSAGRIPTSFHTYTTQEHGRITRTCTGKYKIAPIERKIRELLGARVWEEPCRWCEATGLRVAPWDTAAGVGPCSVCVGTGTRRRVDRAPKGSRVRHMIGFSADEVLDRATTAGFPATTTPFYPLSERNLTRADCEQIIRRNGRKPVRSLCKKCPNHANREWRDMRDNRPAEWAEACDYDDAIREMPGLRGKRYLHASMVPLRKANIDKPSRAELANAQTDVLELLQLLEDGPSVGCSPYGCRSTELHHRMPAVDLPMPTTRPGNEGTAA